MLVVATEYILIGHILAHKKLHYGLRVHWGFLIGKLNDGGIFDIINYVGKWIGRYPESLMIIETKRKMVKITLRFPQTESKQLTLNIFASSVYCLQIQLKILICTVLTHFYGGCRRNTSSPVGTTISNTFSKAHLWPTNSCQRPECFPCTSVGPVETSKKSCRTADIGYRITWLWGGNGKEWVLQKNNIKISPLVTHQSTCHPGDKSDI